MQGGSVIRATSSSSDYTNDYFKDSQGFNVTWFISTAFGSTNMSIYGRGTVDANGYYLANTVKYGINFLVPIICTNFTVDGMRRSRDSGAWGIVTARSSNLAFYNLKIFNHLDTGEDDGIDVNESQNVGCVQLHRHFVRRAAYSIQDMDQQYRPRYQLAGNDSSTSRMLYLTTASHGRFVTRSR